MQSSPLRESQSETKNTLPSRLNGHFTVTSLFSLCSRQTGPNRVRTVGDEEVCVSKIGLIIALVITALLALVAVAIAVSCWLMAYRR